MKFPILTGIRRRIRKAAYRLRPKAVILLYHRVSDVESDPQSMCVRPHRFAEHVEYLANHFSVISLHELAESAKVNRRVQDRAVVITFDDGYADNLLYAKPLLEPFRTPATVFVTTGSIDQREEFWWDELERILLQPSILPSRIHLQVNGQMVEQDLAAAADYTEQEALRDRAWNVMRPDNPTVRHKLYRDLCSLLRPLTLAARTETMRALRSWSGVQAAGRQTHRALSSRELRDLEAGQLIEVGAHTVSHSVLSQLPVSEQRAEISGSCARLAEVLGKAPRSFAYPFGTKADYTAETITLVREAGFTAACSNFHDCVIGTEDGFQLPRMIVRDWDSEKFARILNDWFQGDF